ncbi:MAG: alpha/beta-type small acid-soluble spore protein [Candidatus Choladocola sp.]|nr:alpha/beta-type small acid-soluble spore protein [Candidatus Choladocola sp.]
MSNRSSNTTAVPEAKSALDRFKFEVASELGVPLTDGYNGNLTSRQNGSVGGYMVKKMIEAQERQMTGTGQVGMGQTGMGQTGTSQASGTSMQM